MEHNDQAPSTSQLVRILEAEAGLSHLLKGSGYDDQPSHVPSPKLKQIRAMVLYDYEGALLDGKKSETNPWKSLL